MATARKTYVPSTTRTNPQQYAQFVKDVLAGTVVATKLIETKDANGRITKLEYDDPNG